MSRYKYPFIIKDSSQNMYKFSMNENNDLILEKFYENNIETKIILKEAIKNFVVDIDDKDIIHVVYIDKNNRIKYSIYSNELIDNNFFVIKDENNDSRFLFFKFIIDRLYLFFITRSLNDAECILKSCIIVDNSLTIENILTVSCSKYICPYFIHSTTDYIYILYSKNCDEKYIIQIFDIHKNKWYTHSNIVSLKKASHINFIVKNDTALICYNSFENNNMELHLTAISLKIPSSLVTEQTLSLNTSCAPLFPLILTSKNNTFILWEEGEKILYCNFSYEESFIVKKQYVPIEKSEIHFANYKSNFCEILKTNSTIAYTFKENFLYIITNFQNITSYKVKKNSTNSSNKLHKDTSAEILKEISILEEISSDTESISYTPINVDFLEITPYLNNYIKELYSSSTNISEILNNCVEKNKKLNDEIDYLTKLNSSYKSRIEDLKNRLIKYRNDSAIMLMKYKSIIENMETEKKKLVSIMGEKDAIILSLQNIINSYKK